MNAKTFFSAEQRRRIDEAVKAAEQKTAGEIVPVLAGAADGYDRGLFLASLMVSGLVTLLTLAVVALPLGVFAFAPWETPLWLLLPAQVVGLVLGYQLAARAPALHRAFIPRAYMQRRVDALAKQSFKMFHLTSTEGATGIMIFVALFERMVVVLADKAINDKHDARTWDGVRDLLIDGLKKDDAVGGYERAIAACGRILEKDFPIEPGDTNELPNHLRVI